MTPRSPDATRCRGRLAGGLARSLFVLVSLLALATPASAATGLSSLAGLQALLVVLVAIFAAFWGVGLLVLRAVNRRTRALEAASGRAARMRPPIGLRLLSVVQHVLAFVWALNALFRITVPSNHPNDPIYIFFAGMMFSLLALVSAEGYRRLSTSFGFKTGIALGWLCMIEPLVVLLWHGGWWGLQDPLTPIFGVVLLAVLGFGYRSRFGYERRIWTPKRFKWASTAALVSVVTLGTLATTSRFVMTQEFDEEAAFAALDDLATLIEDHHTRTGSWPESLSELEEEYSAHVGWTRIAYDPEQLRLVLPVSTSDQSDLAYRLSFGIFGGDFLGVTEIALSLKARRPGEPEA
jgi:hypothetical protein